MSESSRTEVWWRLPDLRIFRSDLVGLIAISIFMFFPAISTIYRGFSGHVWLSEDFWLRVGFETPWSNKYSIGIYSVCTGWILILNGQISNPQAVLPQLGCYLRDWLVVPLPCGGNRWTWDFRCCKPSAINKVSHFWSRHGLCTKNYPILEVYGLWCFCLWLKTVYQSI